MLLYTIHWTNASKIKGTLYISSPCHLDTRSGTLLQHLITTAQHLMTSDENRAQMVCCSIFMNLRSLLMKMITKKSDPATQSYLNKAACGYVKKAKT